MAVDPNIKKKADDIRNKVYGKEVRESLASGLEAMSEDVVDTVSRQGNVESQFQDVIDNTTGKDVISAPEIIAARNGEANLKTRIDKDHQEVTAQLAQKVDEGQVKVSDINKNYGLLDETYLSDTLKAQIAGTTSIGSTPPDKSITTKKTTFFETGKNKIDKEKFTKGYYVNQVNGDLFANASHMTSDYTLIKSGIAHAINYPGRLAYYDPEKKYISGENLTSASTPVVFTPPPNAKYIRYSINNEVALGTLQLEEGEENTSFEPFEEKIPEQYLELPEPPQTATPYLLGSGTKDNPENAFISAGNVSTRVNTVPISLSGELQSITFRSSATGLIKIKFFEQEQDVLAFKGEVTLNARIGLHTYYVDNDFASIEVERGWLVGFYSDGNGPKVPFERTDVPSSFFFAGEDVTENKIIDVTASYFISIYVTVEKTIKQISEEIENIEFDTNEFKPVSLLLNEKFQGSELPSGFTNNGFTINNGARFTGYGDLDKQLTWNYNSVLDSANTRIWFTADSINPDLALIKGGSSAGVYRVDGVNKKLIMYAPHTQGTPTLPDIIKEIVLPFDFIIGHQYLIELERKTIKEHIFRLTDVTTGDKVELKNDFVDTRVFSIGSGKTGVMGIGGDFTINKMQYASNEPIKPRLSIYGDSFIEGATLILEGLENRYADLLKSRLNGDVFISGRGGKTSSRLVDLIDTDFKTEKADYTVLAIGTNDSVFDTWLSNITELIEVVEAKGSTPILMTLTKMTNVDRTAFMNSVNDWIINSGHLYVDANLATTLNNDRQTQDTTLFKADGVHPSVDGHKVIYERFLIDVPEVFDGY